MSGKLKVHVDQDKCQGHARCKALAPELFELDEYGNAHVAGDGSVPAGLEARQIELPGNRDRRDRRVRRNGTPI
jgi:ferredoxin